MNLNTQMHSSLGDSSARDDSAPASPRLVASSNEQLADGQFEALFLKFQTGELRAYFLGADAIRSTIHYLKRMSLEQVSLVVEVAAGRCPAELLRGSGSIGEQLFAQGMLLRAALAIGGSVESKGFDGPKDVLVAYKELISFITSKQIFFATDNEPIAGVSVAALKSEAESVRIESHPRRTHRRPQKGRPKNPTAPVQELVLERAANPSIINQCDALSEALRSAECEKGADLVMEAKSLYLVSFKTKKDPLPSLKNDQGRDRAESLKKQGCL